MAADIADGGTSTIIAAVETVVIGSMEGSNGRRCSARYIGKVRPSYAYKKPAPDPATVAKKQVARKKPKIDHGKQSLEAPVFASEPKENGVLEEPSIASEPVGPIVPVDAESSGGPQTGAVKSAFVLVKETLRQFNTHYLHFVQEEEKRVKQVEEAICSKLSYGSQLKLKWKNQKKLKDSALNISDASNNTKSKGAGGEEDVKRPSKRPDLKAISKMKECGTVLYAEKKIGHLPGINVGHQFFSRAEMVVLGVHHHWLNGIDYMGQSYASKEQYKDFHFPLAVCIVLSGMYEDDSDDSETITYTGQGGHDLLGNKKQIGDQKMERGNLALKNSKLSGVPVRVVRGHESRSSYCGKVYTYDGLYKVLDYWAEKGLSGFTVFKYKLKRVGGQPVLTTNQVHFTRAQAPKSVSELRGLVCEDISGGQENFPIPATNVIDDPPIAPTGFVYRKSIQLAKSLKLPTNGTGCKCRGECIDPRTCSCARLNGSDFPYVRKDGGRLVEAKAVVFECGPHCGCNLSCVNRTSQQGLKHRLEVFRTLNKGWAVRSWDTIPSGAPICEYTGILTRTDEIDYVSGNNFIFEIDCLQTMKGLDGREMRPGNMALLANFDDKKSEPEYCIDAGPVGNIARFINHSCQPNLFVQCVLSSHHDIKMAKVMLFAADTIPPLQELTYDYGYALDSVVGPDGNIVKMPCYCGAVECRKRLY